MRMVTYDPWKKISFESEWCLGCFPREFPLDYTCQMFIALLNHNKVLSHSLWKYSDVCWIFNRNRDLWCFNILYLYKLSCCFCMCFLWVLYYYWNLYSSWSCLNRIIYFNNMAIIIYLSSSTQLLSDGKLLLALFSYVKANEMMSPPREWTVSQFEELQLLALAALAQLGPLMIDDYMTCQGSTRLLLLLEWCVGSGVYCLQLTFIYLFLLH